AGRREYRAEPCHLTAPAARQHGDHAPGTDVEVLPGRFSRLAGQYAVSERVADEIGGNPVPVIERFLERQQAQHAIDRTRDLPQPTLAPCSHGRAYVLNSRDAPGPQRDLETQ